MVRPATIRKLLERAVRSGDTATGPVEVYERVADRAQRRGTLFVAEGYTFPTRMVDGCIPTRGPDPGPVADGGIDLVREAERSVVGADGTVVHVPRRALGSHGPIVFVPETVEASEEDVDAPSA